MSTMETAKEIVTIMACVKAEYVQRYEKEPSDEILCMLTDRTHRQLISNDIQKDRSMPKQSQPSQPARTASEKQIAYIVDLGGSPDWTGTSIEASAEIERLKKK